VYRDISLELQVRFGNQNSYTPEFTPPNQPIFIPDTHCNVAALQDAMQEVLTSLPKVEIKPVAKLKPTVSLEDMMDTLRTRIETHVLTKFSDIRAREPEHNNIIVGFLAILEIFKKEISSSPKLIGLRIFIWSSISKGLLNITSA
jgi:chromatin segregation and condensation protein Rec8/ScpA/Scc1 (kleisin family)